MTATPVSFCGCELIAHKNLTLEKICIVFSQPIDPNQAFEIINVYHEGGTLLRSKKKFEYAMYKDRSEITNPGMLIFSLSNFY